MQKEAISISPLAFPPGDPLRRMALEHWTLAVLADTLLDWRALGWPILRRADAWRGLPAGSWALRCGDPGLVALDSVDRLVVSDLAAVLRVDGPGRAAVPWRLEARLGQGEALRLAWIGMEDPAPRIGACDWVDVLLTVPPSCMGR